MDITRKCQKCGNVWSTYGGEPYYCTRCEQGKNIEVKIRQLEYEIQTLKRKLAGLQENRDEGVQ